jgi:SWI/SNF-related matrix-associated actin-dependent regulator 1 of chromatin subfamily A
VSERRADRFIYLDGQSTPAHRATEIRRFHEDPRCVAAVVSILAFAEGVTFTAANYVVFLQTSFNGSRILQGEGRLIRIGQWRHVTIYYVQLGDEPLEERIWRGLVAKIKNDGALLGSERHARFAAEVQAVVLPHAAPGPSPPLSSLV